MKKNKQRRSPPYYLVCGMPRGGTSMMMQSLIAGGMPAKYIPSGEGIERDKREGFLSNPVDVYEWPRMPQRLPRSCRGKVVKIFPWRMFDLEPGPFKVMLITREEASLRASIEKYIDFASSRPNEKVNPQVIHAKKVIDHEDAGDLFKALAKVIPQLPTVREFDVVSYEEVCSNPSRVFNQLAQRGWPINPEAAAAVPNPNWRQEVIESEKVLLSA